VPSGRIPEGEPTRLGEYHLLEKLGQGGMAMVYRGERFGEAGFKKKVALKRMLPQYRRNPSLLERFAAEARTNARLDHPNLVQVIDFGIDPEPFLVLEFVEGVTLAALLQRLVERREMLELSAACFIGAEAAQGLDHAHRKRDEQGNPLGIVHRDVSPQNVLLSNEGAVKVSDFGLVKAADNVVQTGSGIPIGKISYMAPEQAGHSGVDARADVFSLGVVVWEMCTLRTLLPTNDMQKATELLTKCNFRRPSEINPKVSPALDDIVMRCLARDPDQRTPSAQAVSMQLREVLHEIAPGYGRDQLARLVSWAFPERKWVIDEPHETAAQPTAAERQSMPQVLASEAMARVSMERAAPAVVITGQHVAQSAPPPQRSTGSALGWVLVLGGAALVGLVGLVIVLAVAFFVMGSEESSSVPPPTSGSAIAPPATPSMWIEANVPHARVFHGPIDLGPAPVQITADRLNGDPIIVIAPGNQPAVLASENVERALREGRTREQLVLLASESPDRVVFVRYPREAMVRLAATRRVIGRAPGVVLVGDPGGLVAPQIEIVEADGMAVRVSTANCDPLRVCLIEGGAI
jgi:serine/threonine protein kinase